MGWRGLSMVVGGWVLLTLYDYYYGNYFVIALEWLVLSFGLVLVCIYQLVRVFAERKSLRVLRLAKLAVFLGLFLLTYFHWWTHGLIERADWAIYSGARKGIVADIQSGKVRTQSNGFLWQLPFHFPPMANGGNEVFVKVNPQNGKWTIAFPVFANFMDSPSIYRIYSDDVTEIHRLEQTLRDDPSENWKLEDNWYRVMAEFPW